MKTIKLTISNHIDILDDMREFNSVVRMGFNRFQDGMNENEVRHYCKQKFNTNSWILHSAVKEALYTFKTFGNKHIIFGGKYNLSRYIRGLIDKETFKYNRLRPISIMGDAAVHGNRLFSFNLTNNQLIYKPTRHRHIEINFLPMKKNVAMELEKVQCLIDQNKIPIYVRLSDKNIWITYDERILPNTSYKNLNNNRIMGIDMNPNYIGVSIIEFNQTESFKIVHKQVFDLSDLTVSSGKSCTHKKSKYLTNKLRHETIDIAHKISNLVNQWKCKTVSIEDLTFNQFDTQKGSWLNQLCHNKWERSLFVNKLKMLASIHQFDIAEINPAYSSIVGNIAYGNENTPDMVAASIEIARRAYKKYEKGWFYPRFNIQFRDEQWKQTLGSVDDWKGLFSKIKETGLKYRFLLRDYVQNAVFSKNYRAKHYSIYTFA